MLWVPLGDKLMIKEHLEMKELESPLVHQCCDTRAECFNLEPLYTRDLVENIKSKVLCIHGESWHKLTLVVHCSPLSSSLSLLRDSWDPPTGHMAMCILGLVSLASIFLLLELVLTV